MARQTGYYFVKPKPADPWVVYYWSYSAAAWLHNGKRYSNTDLHKIDGENNRLQTPDERALNQPPNTYHKETKT